MSEPLVCSAKGVPGAGRLGAGLEQPEAAHARPPQVLARVRRSTAQQLADFLGARGFLREVVPAAEAPDDPGPAA